MLVLLSREPLEKQDDAATDEAVLQLEANWFKPL